MPAWKDRVKQAVTTGGSGALVIGSASSGYQALASGDNGKVFRYVIEDGTAWETGYGIYTHSGTSFARTSRDASSTGSALNVSTSAFLFIDLTAAGALSAENGARGVTPGGRITLGSSTPVTSDASAQPNVYYTPFVSDVITLWDGNIWAAVQFSELTMSLASGYVANVNYDVYGYLSAGALAVETAAWKNSTVTITIAAPGVVTWNSHGMLNGETVVFATTGALPTGLAAGTVYYVVSSAANTFQVAATPGGSAITTTGSQSGTHTAYHGSSRQTALTIQDGRYCKSGDKTRLYLGMFRTVTATTTEDTALNRFVWNAYNRVARNLWCTDTTSSWTYGSTSWRQARGQTSNRVQVVNGLLGLTISLVISQVSQNTSLGSAQVAVGVNNTFTQATNSQGSQSVAGGAFYGMASAVFNDYVGVGYQSFNWLERSSGTSTMTFYGANIDTAGGFGGAYTNGMSGRWEC